MYFRHKKWYAYRKKSPGTWGPKVKGNPHPPKNRALARKTSLPWSVFFLIGLYWRMKQTPTHDVNHGFFRSSTRHIIVNYSHEYIHICLFMCVLFAHDFPFSLQLLELHIVLLSEHLPTAEGRSNLSDVWFLRWVQTKMQCETVEVPLQPKIFQVGPTLEP